MVEAVLPIRASCNQYDWGKQGSKSIAARLCQSAGGWDGDGPKTTFKIQEDKPYAEMWYGTYPELPTYVASSGEKLQDVIDKDPKAYFGENVLNKFGHSQLPYLPKVLSIAKALPLQLHPNKDLASKLHKEDPESFTDPNHKPEIAVALGEFEAFCGFKPLAEITEHLKLEPLQQFREQDSSSELTNSELKEVVRSMLKAPESTVKEVYSALLKLPASAYGKSDYIPKLAPRLAEQYTSADNGILVALVTMNYLVLQAGESIYIPADGIHAYLSGDIIECMARSNNVLNTGFCPAADRDNVDTFCSVLSFKPHSAQESMLPPKAWSKSKNGKTKVFSPPLSEFDMLAIELQAGESETLGAVNGPGVFLVTSGSAKIQAEGKTYELQEGQTAFVKFGTELNIDAGDKGLLAHHAICE